MHVLIKHSLAHLQDLIPTLAVANTGYISCDWFELVTCLLTFYCDSYFLFQILLYRKNYFKQRYAVSKVVLAWLHKPVTTLKPKMWIILIYS